jgi:uncharacterized protein YkwD
MMKLTATTRRPFPRSIRLAAICLLGVFLMTAATVDAQVSYDAAAEQHILDLANEARTKVGLPALKLDPGLTAAARQHSALMAGSKQLSHDLPGEPALPVRLSDAAKVNMTSEGENVAFASSIEDSHQRFMDSPHHRANLLDAKFNLVGFGVVHDGRMVYVTQDFVRATGSKATTTH